MVTAVESSEFGRDLTRILARARVGDRFVITENGDAVAELGPARRTEHDETPLPGAERATVEQTIQAFRELRRRTVPTTPAEIRELINEGRR